MIIPITLFLWLFFYLTEFFVALICIWFLIKILGIPLKFAIQNAYKLFGIKW